MRTFTLFSIFTLLTFSLVKAQNPISKIYTEHTHINLKVGMMIGYQFSYAYEVGAFFQTVSHQQESTESNYRRHTETEFYGLYLAAPLIHREKLDFKLAVRTGAVNKVNFVITPSLLAQYRLLNWLEVEGGIGVRSFRPTFQSGFKIRL